MELTARLGYPAYSTAPQSDVKLLCTVSGGVQEASGTSRCPVSVSAVVDKSGSMSGSKMKLVKKACQFMATQLQQADQLGVVSYSHTVSSTLAPTSMTDAARKSATSAISNIVANGGTNLSDGLFAGVQQQIDVLQAYRQAAEAAQPSTSGNGGDWEMVAPAAGPRKPVQSVLLFTDGLANQGLTNTSDILESLTAMANEADASIKVHCFGFGADHDPAMLQAISESTGGTYYFIQNASMIPGAFADALGGLMSTVAQATEVSLKPLMPGLRLEASVVDFSTTLLPEGGVTISLGDVYSQERKDLVLRLQLPEGAAGEALPLVDVSLTYRSTLTQQERTVKQSLSIKRSPPDALPAEMEVDDAVEEHSLRVDAAKAMKEAVAQADKGDMAGARKMLGGVQERLARKKAAPYASAALSALSNDVQACTLGMADACAYAGGGAMHARAAYKSHAAQRSRGAVHQVVSSAALDMSSDDEEECQEGAVGASAGSQRRLRSMFSFGGGGSGGAVKSKKRSAATPVSGGPGGAPPAPAATCAPAFDPYSNVVQQSMTEDAEAFCKEG